MIDLFQQGALTLVAGLDVEPDYGYLARVNYHNGTHRVVYGNDLGINSGSACDLAKDKGHTKFVLETMGVCTPRGSTFLFPEWAAQVREGPGRSADSPIREIRYADAYVEGHFGYPAYVKPVNGAKGTDIFKVHNRTELDAALATLAVKRTRVALIEEPVPLPDYRIVTLDGELVAAYRRTPLAVVGDGETTVGQLIESMRDGFVAAGRDARISHHDPRIATHLGRTGRTLDSVPVKDERVTLLPVANLSTGGTAEDVSDVINPHWTKLAGHIASGFNLRLCGLDLACEDITDAGAAYSVFEVNAKPGLDHYALSGAAQRATVDGLYVRVLDVYP